MSAELSSLGIAQIVESVIADYDLRDEDGNELTDDLYVIRSEQLDELGLTVASASTRPYANWRRKARPASPCIRWPSAACR